MLRCKVFESDNTTEVMDFDIVHFSERMIGGNITLSIVFNLDKWESGSLDKYAPLTKCKAIGNIQFFDNDDLIGEYSGYNLIQGISCDYEPGGVRGVAMCVRGENGHEVTEDIDPLTNK